MHDAEIGFSDGVVLFELIDTAGKGHFTFIQNVYFLSQIQKGNICSAISMEGLSSSCSNFKISITFFTNLGDNPLDGSSITRIFGSDISVFATPSIFLRPP